MEACLTGQSSKPIPLPELRSMRTFDPSQPAILHDRRTDQIIPWDGDAQDHYRRYSIRHPDGTVGYEGWLLDGWGNVLGG